MYKIRCIVIEDEPLAVKVLTDYITQTPFLELQACFKDAVTAAAWLNEQETGLIFLDIHLPKLKGMAFLKTLQHPPPVIITTAYHQYAVEGFELNVADYLVKPVEYERFLTAVNKVAAAQRLRQQMEDAAARDCIFLMVQKKKVKVLFAEIVYVESQREYIKVVTTRGELVTKMSTHEIESLLPADQFKRVHRSFIISIKRIDAYTADMVEVNGITIPVGRAYRDVIEGL